MQVHTDRYEAFTKNAYIFDKEKGTNLALILSGSLHKQDGERTRETLHKSAEDDRARDCSPAMAVGYGVDADSEERCV